MNFKTYFKLVKEGKLIKPKQRVHRKPPNIEDKKDTGYNPHFTMKDIVLDQY